MNERREDDIKLTIRCVDENHLFELQYYLEIIYGPEIKFESAILLEYPRNIHYKFISFWHVNFSNGGSRR